MENILGTSENGISRKDYEGKTFVDIYGDKFTVTKYENYRRSSVVYEDGTCFESVNGNQIRRGTVRSSNHPSVKDRTPIYEDMRKHKDVWAQGDASLMRDFPTRENQLNYREYVGRTFINVYGEPFTVVHYRSHDKVTVEYSGRRSTVDLTKVKSGKIETGRHQTLGIKPIYKDMRNHFEIWNSPNMGEE